MIYYILAGLIFAWLSWRWLLQVDSDINSYVDAPMGFTFLCFPVLVISAMETSVWFMSLLGLISLGLHLNYKYWRPFNTGVAASLAIGILLVLAGVVSTTTPSGWANNPDDAFALFTAATITGCAATRISTSTGYLPRYFAILSGLYYDGRGASASRKYGYRRDDDSRYERFLHWMGFLNYTMPVKNAADREAEAEEELSNPDRATDPHEDSDVTPADLRASAEDHPFRDSPNADQHDESQEDAAPEWSVTPVEDRDGGTADGEDEEDAPDEEQDDQSDAPAEESDDEGVTEYQFPWEEPPEMRFEDIGGYPEVKDALREQVVSPLRGNNPSYDRFGIEPSRGLLFYGPPGTGKTLFARALANELNRPFVELTQADLTHEFINKSPQIIQRLFEEAQELGGVVFIDEAEQLLGSREDSLNSHAEDKKITNMFLSALTKEDKDYIILLTTNLKESMDDAILRPGRIDEDFEIGLPESDTRLEIIKIKLAEVPHEITQDQAESVASKTGGWSGADLNALINQAKFKAVDREAQKLKFDDIKLAYRDMESDRE